MKCKIIVWASCIAILLNTASASVVISQVLCNPVNTESGGEAVEIFNSGSADIDISGWAISTEASGQDAIIPSNTIICAGCYYLIADKGWNTSRDNMSWPLADHEEPLTMSNIDSGVALANGEEIIDAVGWGMPEEINDGLFKGNPSQNPAEGMALARKSSTNDNRFDFEESAPFFRSSSDIGTGKDSEEVIIEFEAAAASGSQLPSATIDFINLSSRKTAPVPGGTALITVNAQVTGHGIDNATATFEGVSVQMIRKEVNSTASIFSGSFGLDFYMPPGTYLIGIEAGGKKAEIEFEYLELVAIGVSRENVDFGRISAGEARAEALKVRNLGNVEVDLGVRTDMPGILSYSFGGNEFKAAAANTVISDINLLRGKSSEKEVLIRVTPQINITTGKYAGKLEITAVGSRS